MVFGFGVKIYNRAVFTLFICIKAFPSKMFIPSRKFPNGTGMCLEKYEGEQRRENARVVPGAA
jgi:hypothetical protein